MKDVELLVTFCPSYFIVVICSEVFLWGHKVINISYI